MFYDHLNPEQMSSSTEGESKVSLKKVKKLKKEKDKKRTKKSKKLKKKEKLKRRHDTDDEGSNSPPSLPPQENAPPEGKKAKLTVIC